LKAAEYEALLKALPPRTLEVQADIKRKERTPPQFSSKDIAGLSMDQLQRSVSEVAARLASNNNELNRLNEQYQAQQNRPARIHAELQSIDIIQDDFQDQIPISSGGSAEIDRLIRQWVQEVRQRLFEARRLALEKELFSLNVQLEWLRVQISHKTQQGEFDSQELKLKEDRLAQLRTEDAQNYRQQIMQDEKDLDSLQPLVSELARKNIALSDLLVETTEKIAKVSASTSSVNETMAGMTGDFERTRQKIEVAGLSQALGQVLLEERRRLSTMASTGSSTLVSQKKIAEVGLRQIQHEEERQSLRVSRKAMEASLTGINPEEAETIRKKLTELVEQRRVLLDRMIAADQSYLQALSDLDFAQGQLRKRTEVYRDFITERLLWIRSSQAIDFKMIMGIPAQILSFADVTLVQRLGNDMERVVRSHWLTSLLYCVALFVFLRRRRDLRNALQGCALPLKRLTTDSFLYSLKALVISVLLALPLASLLILLGSALMRTDGLGKIATALGPVIWEIGRFVFFLQLVRQLSREDGIFRAHFKWKNSFVDQFALCCSRLLYLAVPALLIATFLISYDFGALPGGLHYVSLAVAMGVWSYVLLAVLKASPVPVLTSTGLVSRVRVGSGRFLRVASIAGPLFLALVALSGYVYTATTLILHILDTFSFILLLILVHLMVLRWLLLAQRKLAYQDALERRAAMRQKASEVPSEDTTAGFESVLEVDEPKIDFEAVSKGGRELLNTVLAISGAAGIWIIWAEILPAFGILDKFALWQYTDKIGDQEIQVPVTIFDLGLAIFIISITMLATKRVPALLEFILLQRLSLSAGGMYTVKTLSGYVIVAIGMMLTFNSIGASWSQIQWLVAALSVGIGFGLQEIVANFISGLIILFERPIRVGDVVTVGDTDGVVTRINIRATTIRNWEQKELLVPNKEFITGRLLNWTLSDQTTRIFIPVGIAYGSDVEKAMDILLDIIKSQPNVMTDPGPSVFFESLADNSLILNIRCFVAKLDYRLPTISEMHTRIYKDLMAAGISIAFQQRDVHLDTMRPLEVRLLHDVPKPAETGQNAAS
jgi:potassium efflux system protein